MLLFIFTVRDVQKAAHGYAIIRLNAELKYKGNTQPAALTGLHSDSNINLQKPGGKRKKNQQRKKNSSFGRFFFHRSIKAEWQQAACCRVSIENQNNKALLGLSFFFFVGPLGSNDLLRDKNPKKRN